MAVQQRVIILTGIWLQLALSGSALASCVSARCTSVLGAV
jgi:hypothetical protein